MKKIIYAIALVVSLTSCSQNKKIEITHKTENKKIMELNHYIPIESKDITTNNYAEKVLESIKHYEKEPIYYFRINKQNCLIEVSINNIADYKDYKLSNMITPVEINHILKSGPQKVTVKMYPVGDLNNESFGVKDAPPITKLSEGSQVSISVISIDEKSPKGLDDEKLITTQVSPKEAAGKEYFEFSFTFDAKVPYEFEGWTKGQNLMKLDQDLVRKKALEYYEMAGNIILNKDLNTWLKIQYPLEKRLMGSMYANKESLDELVKEFKEKITLRDYTVLPITDIKMEYMGEGKLLRLQKISSDLKNKKSVLGLEYKNGKYYPGITLYLPEGRDLATQGFMMWK